MKFIFILLTIISTMNIFSFQSQKILSRESNFRDIFYVCLKNDTQYISVDNILNELKLTNFKNDYIPFDLYLYNNGQKEKIFNNKLTRLKPTNDICNSEEKKYKFELNIHKKDIIKTPEDQFSNKMKINSLSFDNELSTKNLDIIYNTNAVAIQVKQLKDFNLNYNPSINSSILVENDFCVYTDGAGTFSFSFSDQLAGDWQLTHQDLPSEKIDYSLRVKTSSTGYQNVIKNNTIVGFNGNTDINCAVGDLFQLEISIPNSELIKKYSGTYKPDNVSNAIYITVTLDGAPI